MDPGRPRRLRWPLRAQSLLRDRTAGWRPHLPRSRHERVGRRDTPRRRARDGEAPELVARVGGRKRGDEADLPAWQQSPLAPGRDGRELGRGAQCNSYAYKFAGVSIARKPGGMWTPLNSGTVFSDP